MHSYRIFARKSQIRYCMKVNCFKKVPWCIFLFLILFSNSFAQDNSNSVAGLVMNEKSEPMPGVTVVLQSGQVRKSAQTDNSGRFRFDNLDASFTYRLSFSHIGYAQQQMSDVRAGTGSPLSVSMAIDAGTADEVVVVGYGTQTKR